MMDDWEVLSNPFCTECHHVFDVENTEAVFRVTFFPSVLCGAASTLLISRMYMFLKNAMSRWRVRLHNISIKRKPRVRVSQWENIDAKTRVNNRYCRARVCVGWRGKGEVIMRYYHALISSRSSAILWFVAITHDGLCSIIFWLTS